MPARLEMKMMLPFVLRSSGMAGMVGMAGTPGFHRQQGRAATRQLGQFDPAADQVVAAVGAALG